MDIMTDRHISQGDSGMADELTLLPVLELKPECSGEATVKPLV